MYAAHRLAYDADALIFDDTIYIVNDTVAVRRIRKITKIENIFKIYGASGKRLYALSVLVKNAGNSAADYTESQHCYICHVILRNKYIIRWINFITGKG